jgi:hypothetical protein
VKENLINNQGFKECLALIALCSTRSISMHAPVVHTIAESRSSMSLNQNDLSALSRHESEIHPVDKLKWLFRRIYNSSVARESKVQHLAKFRQQFGRNLARDGNPFSYLLPYRLDAQQMDEFGTDTASSNGGYSSSSSSSGANASRRYNRSRAGKSKSRYKVGSGGGGGGAGTRGNGDGNGSQANTARGERYLAKRRVSLAPQSNHLNWITLQDDHGQYYYFNRETNQTQREKPTMGMSQAAAPPSPMTLAQRGDPSALARMAALDDMATAAATTDMNMAHQAQMRLEEEAAQVAARWAASLKQGQGGQSGRESGGGRGGGGPFLDPYDIGRTEAEVEAVLGEESEEEMMRQAMLELGRENRDRISPWQTGSNVSMSVTRDMKRGHGRTATMSGFVADTKS